MPGNGWDLTINVKPRLDPASKKQVVAEMQKLFGSGKIDTKSFEKQFRDALSSAFKGSKIQLPKEELNRFVSSFVKAFSQAAGQIDAAAKNAQRVLSSIPSRQPTSGPPGRPAPPPRTDKDFSGARPTKVSGIPDKETAHKRLQEGLSQAAKVGADSVSEVLKSAAKGSSGATEEARKKIEDGAKKATEKITADFFKLFESVAASARKTNVDLSSIRSIPDLKALAAAHSGRGSAAGNKGAVNVQQVENAYSRFVEGSSVGFKTLKSKILQLSNVTNEGLEITSTRVASLLSDIKSLTSKKSSNRVPVGKGEVRQLEKLTENFVGNALRNVVDKLDRQLDEALEGVIKASQKRKGETGQQLAARMAKAQEALGKVARDFVETIEAIEGAGRYNINKEKPTGPGGKRGPSTRIPQSEAFARNFEKPAERISKYPVAQEALAVANNFKDIYSTAERTSRVFKTLFDKPLTSTEEIKKNMVAVAQAIRHTSTTDIVKKQELDVLATALENYIKQIERLQARTHGVPGAEKAAVPNLDPMLGAGATQREVIRQLHNVQQEVAKTRKGFKTPFSIPYTDALGNLRKLEGEMIRTGDSARKVRVKINKEFSQVGMSGQFRLAFRRVAMWGMAAGLVYGGVTAFRNAIRVMLEAETGLVSLSKVMREADINMEEFRKTTQETAKGIAVGYGTSIKSVYEAMRIFGQQGLKMAEVEKLVEATAVTANVSVLNQAEAAEALTAATRQFGLEASDAMRIVDAWNEVANRNAVTVKTLADATKKAGSAAKTVGIEYEQFLGLVTAIGTATRQPGKEIGTSLRFIFQRSLRPESEKTLNKFGVATRDLSGDFKGFIPLLTDLADRWEDLSRSQKLTIGQALGGARQYNSFLALMNNFGLAMKATNDAINSNGSALDENQKIMATAAKKTEQMRASLHNLYISFGKTLLPVLKDTVDVIRVIIDGFSEWDTSTVKVVSTIGLLTIALSRFSFQMDYVLSAGAGAGGAGFAGMTGLLAGRGLSSEAISAIPIEKKARFGQTALAAKGLNDFSKLTKESTQQLAGVGGKIVDLNQKAVTSTGTFSKFGLVMRNYGVQAEGALTASYLGISSLNSPLAKLGAALFAIGKKPFLWLTDLVFLAPRAAAGLGLLNTATVANWSATIKARIAGLGWVGSLGTLAITAAIASVAISKLWKYLNKPPKRFGKDIEQELRPQIALEEKRLGQVKQQLSWLKRLSTQSSKYTSIETNLSRKRQGLGEDELQRKKDSLLINRLQLAQASKQAGSFLLKVNPSVVKGLDDYGNAIVKTSVDLRQMAKTAISAQAEIVALSRTKVAIGYAEKDVPDSLKRVREELKKVRSLSPSLEALSIVFGDLGASSEGYQKAVTELNRGTSSLKGSISNVIEAIKKFPKETPLEAYVSALRDKSLNKALEIDVDSLGLKDFQKYTGGILTAADKMNQLFLQKKSVKDVKLFGAYTAAALRARKVTSYTLKEMEKEGRDFSTGDLITWEKKRGPFGLTQAVVTVNAEGKKVIEGIGSLRTKVREEIDTVRNDLKNATIFDTGKLVEEASTSVFSAVKKISGAGAGTIKFPAELDIGTKFKFELSGLDRFQTVSKAATAILIDATKAQRNYASATEQFIKSAKDGASGKILQSLVENLNELGRLSSLKTFIVSLGTELLNFSNSVEKAVYELRKSSIADQVEREFSSIYGGISKATVELSKFPSEKSPEERLAQSSPGLSSAITASSKSVDIVKKAVTDFRTLINLDLPKMIAEAPAKDRSKFVEQTIKSRKETNKALKAAGGDKRFAGIIQSNHEIKGSVEKQTDVLSGKFDELMGKDTKDNKILSKGLGKETEYALHKFRHKFMERFEGTQKKAEERQKKAEKQGGKSQVDQLLGAGIGKEIELIKQQFGYIKDAPKELVRQLAERLKQTQVSSSIHQADRARTKGINVAEPAAEGKRTIDWFEKNGLAWADRVGDAIYSVFAGRKKVFSKEQNIQKDILKRLDRAAAASVETPSAVFEELVRAILSDRGPAGTKRGARPLEARELNLQLADKLDKGATFFVKVMGMVGEKMLAPLLKQAAAQQRLLNSIGLAARETQNFVSAVKKSTEELLNMSKTASVFSSLEAPISGAGKGIPQQPQLGKLRGDLSAFDRVFKSNPEFAKSISLQEQSRKSLISTSKTLYQQALTSAGKIRELISSAKTPEQKSRLQEYEKQLNNMADRLVDGVKRANQAAAPFVDTLSRMVHLEQVKMSLEGIVKELQKMSDLEFDTTSIDIALGKHPLSSTAGVYGQPAGLDKFQRKEYEINQKLYAPGGVSGQEMANLQYQKKKLEYDKEEALIQYQQSKENQKLASEVGAGKRALSILWDAQYKGIEGLQPLMDILKGELEDAGKVTSTFGGKREFQGVPSLYDAQKEIAKVQEKVDAKKFTQQRDIVMGPLLDVNRGMAATLEQINKNTEEYTNQIVKETAGGTGKPGDIINSMGKVSEYLSKFTATGVQALSGLASAVRKSEDSGGKDFTGFGLANEAIMRLSQTFSENTRLLQGITDPLTRITETFNEISAKIAQINEGLNKPSYKKVSKNELPSGHFAVGGKVSGPGGPKSDSIPAMLSDGEFVVNASSTKRLGVGFLNSLNKGHIPGFAEGGLVEKFYNETDKKRSEFVIKPQTRSMMTLNGIVAMQKVTKDQSLTEYQKQRQLEEIYTNPKYRKQVVEKPKTDSRLLGEQLGRGTGYIKVGDTYVAYGERAGVDKKYRARKRFDKFKGAVDAYKKGQLKFDVLKKLASGISPAYLRNNEDDILVRSIRAGKESPEEYKKSIQEVENYYKNKDKEPSKEELVAKAEERRVERSKQALVSFLNNRAHQANYKQKELRKAHSVYASATDEIKKREAYRNLQITQYYDADKLSKNRADMAVFAKLASKTGETIGSVKDSKKVKELQKYNPGIGGEYKGKAVLDYMGNKVRLVKWTNPATGQVFAVDSGSILEDGTYYDPVGRTEEGGYKFHGFKIPWEQYTKYQEKMTGYLKYTGGTKPLDFGVGSGVGTIRGFRPDGTPVYDSSDVRRETTLPESREEEALRVAGKNKASQFIHGFGKRAYGFGKGQYEFGKTLASFQDPRRLVVSGIKGESQRFRKEVLDPLVSGMILNPAHNFGFSKKFLKVAAPLPYWLAGGDERRYVRDKSSLIYGLGRAGRMTSPLSAAALKKLGILEDEGAWSPTAASLGESTGDIAAQVSLGLLTKGVHGASAAGAARGTGLFRSAEATLEAGNRFSGRVNSVGRFGKSALRFTGEKFKGLKERYKQRRAERAASKEAAALEAPIGEASFGERALIGAKNILEGPSRLKVGYKGATYGALGIGTLATAFGGTFASGAVAGGLLGVPIAFLIRRFGIGGLKRIIGWMQRRRAGGLPSGRFGKGSLGEVLRSLEQPSVAPGKGGLGSVLGEVLGEGPLGSAKLRGGMGFNRPYFSAGDFGINRGYPKSSIVRPARTRHAPINIEGGGFSGPFAQAEYAEMRRRLRMPASGTIGESNPYLDYTVSGASRRKMSPFEAALGKARARAGKEHEASLIGRRVAGSRFFQENPYLEYNLTREKPSLARVPTPPVDLTPLKPSSRASVYAKRLPRSRFFQENPYLEYSVEGRVSPFDAAVRRPKATPFEVALGKARARMAAEHLVSLNAPKTLVAAMKKAGFSERDMGVYLGALRRGVPVDDLLKLVEQSGKVGESGFGSLSASYSRGSARAALARPLGELNTTRRIGIRYEGPGKPLTVEELREYLLKLEGNRIRREEAARRLSDSGTRTAFATGGFVSGPGGPKSDSIPALLSDGEFVLNADATKRLGSKFLHRLNKGGVPGFALGGGVGSAISDATGVLSNIANNLIKDFLNALAEESKSQLKGFSTLLTGFGGGAKSLPMVSSSSTLSTEQLLAMRGKIEGHSAPTVTPLVAGTGMTQKELLARRGKLSNGTSGVPIEDQFVSKSDFNKYIAQKAQATFSAAAPGGVGIKSGAVSGLSSAANKAVFSSIVEQGKLEFTSQEQLSPKNQPTGPGSGEEMSPEASALSSVIDNFNITISQLSAKAQDLFGGRKEPTGPGSGDEMPYVPGKNIKTKEQTSEQTSSIDSEGIAKAVASALKDIFSSSKLDIAPESISALKTSIEESSITFKDNLEKATFTGLGDNIKTALSNTTVEISPESISAIGKTITDASKSIGTAIKEATPTVTTAQGKQLSGLGAAVRPEVIEELQGRVEILGEKIDTTKNDIQTDLNQKLSELSDNITIEVKKYYEPKIVQTDYEIQSVRHEVNGIQALIQNLNSRINRV